MIASVRYFGDLTPEQEAAHEFNFRERFKAALTAQDGFIAGYWLRDPQGRRISLTIWESEEQARRGGQRANATPLLPGQEGALIVSPQRVETCQVIEQL